ncbi:MAG: hypothetical protein QMD88_07685 [Coprothermobacterota bacterium]|nr:hypothetical protein [Coprothermobacterota bacterium]
MGLLPGVIICGAYFGGTELLSKGFYELIIYIERGISQTPGYTISFPRFNRDLTSVMIKLRKENFRKNVIGKEGRSAWQK